MAPAARPSRKSGRRRTPLPPAHETASLPPSDLLPARVQGPTSPGAYGRPRPAPLPVVDAGRTPLRGDTVRDLSPMSRRHYLSFAVGLGLHMRSRTLAGVWSEEKSRLHITVLELEAVVRALAALRDHVRGRSLTVFSDNTTVVAYINRQGGTHSPQLCLKVMSLLQ
ncbi:hypothetical protein HOLleu_09945 [Holothuria leucospilota]|uniref:Uncharacterized protein n=1 Tax=Holothuria leucospilota TaxID=206669 RepID=A0A9Q1CCA9_HOLLE|nr:hypothetical protein HOLleu_09945 [Holothuria leucospilota]